jgi:hypothetical protein
LPINSPEEYQYVLHISSFCLMPSLKVKEMFDCHGNTQNSSPIYSYTNYMMPPFTVFRIFFSSFLFSPFDFSFPFPFY